MTINYSTLMELQNVLSQIFAVEEKIKDIPLDLNDKESVLQKTKLDYLELSSKCEKVQQDLEEINKKYIQSGKAREELELSMLKTVLVRESENTDKEIEILKQTEQTLFKTKNAKQLNLNNLKEKIAVQAEIVKAQEEEVAEERKKKDVLIAEQQKILSDLIVKRDLLSKDFPSNFLFKFERIIKNKNNIGVVPLHGIICQGCFMELPQQFANTVRKNDDINFCPYCSRVLFFEESEEDSVASAIYGDILTDDSDFSADSIFDGENLLDD